jgi:ketosteroid isomerase-like protein
MRSRVLLLASLLLALAACVSRPTTTSEEFARIEQSWIEALQSHDTAALGRLLADDFLDSTWCGGVRTREQVLSGPPAAARPYHSVRLEELKVRTPGRDTAIVTGVNVLESADPEDRVRIRFTDVFVREDGRWRAVSAQETLQSGSCGRGEGASR